MVTLILDFILIPKYGIIGASISNATSYFVLLVSLFLFQYSKDIIPIRNYFIVNTEDVKLIKNQIYSIKGSLFK